MNTIEKVAQQEQHFENPHFKENRNFFYRGVVEDNNHPEKNGMVRVRIHGIHTEKNEKSGEKFEFIKTSELPWAEVIGSNEFGLVGGVGLSSVLRQGTWVWVILDNDDPNKPIVIGTIKGKVSEAGAGKYASGVGFCDPAGVFPYSNKVGAPDIHEKVRASYPNLAVIETPSGHILEIDDTPGNARIKVTHKSGTSITIDDSGNMNVLVVGNLQYDVSGTTTINSGGNYKVVAPRIDLN